MSNDLQAGGISIHAVDVARGIPAAGLEVTLVRLSPGPAEVAQGTCGAGGHFDHPVAQGAGVLRGTYEVRFDVAACYAHSDLTLPDPAFMDVAVFRFGIDRVTEHFHLPFKFTPWGFSLFRGGA